MSNVGFDLPPHLMTQQEAYEAEERRLRREYRRTWLIRFNNWLSREFETAEAIIRIYRDK